MRKHLWLILAVLVMALAFSLGTAASAETAPEFAAQGELPENAILEQLTWLDAVVYEYIPSQLYDPMQKMAPIFYFYPDEPLKSLDDAWKKLNDSGLQSLAEEQRAIVFLFTPADGESFGSADYDQCIKLSKALCGTRGLDFEYSFSHGTVNLLKLYTVGEGKGADFITRYLTDGIASSMTSGTVLVGATAVPETPNYAIPAYLAGCTDEVVAFYRGINGTDTEGTLNGSALYYNSTYVMDTGYTPKRVIVSEGEQAALDADTLETAYNDLLRHVCKHNLENSYFVEGVEGAVVSERPVIDELNLTFNEISGEAAEGSGMSRWYEWVPNEVLDTMANGTDETYPLIVVMHGNTDHEVFSAEANGWVWLADEQNLIVVSPLDIYELGMPPEAAKTRYGKENAEWIRNVICEKYPVDMSRIYITGFSIGAFVTADTSAADPGLFAAAAPIAYPGDGYMQIWPYEDYGSDPAKYDMPMMYMCGRSDNGNTMVNPKIQPDPNAGPYDNSRPRVMATQLFFNQVLTFNEMNSQLIDLVELDYDLYPGESDAKTNRETGEVTGGYDFWDGTAAQYITQNLDFEAYPFYGFDVVGTEHTSRDEFTTPEGVQVERNIYYNEDNQPMLEFLVMGNMGHNLYTRYANIIWNDLFSHYSRDPETGALSFN